MIHWGYYRNCGHLNVHQRYCHKWMGPNYFSYRYFFLSFSSFTAQWKIQIVKAAQSADRTPYQLAINGYQRQLVMVCTKSLFRKSWMVKLELLVVLNKFVVFCKMTDDFKCKTTTRNAVVLMKFIWKIGNNTPNKYHLFTLACWRIHFC